MWSCCWKLLKSKVHGDLFSLSHDLVISCVWISGSHTWISGSYVLNSRSMLGFVCLMSYSQDYVVNLTLNPYICNDCLQKVNVYLLCKKEMQSDNLLWYFSQSICHKSSWCVCYIWLQVLRWKNTIIKWKYYILTQMFGKKQ